MLSDEEKEAIEWLKRLVKLNKRDNLDDTFAEILLNLIEKQSKEIEELKEKRLTLFDTTVKNSIKINNKKWEDKIKAKIEEYKKEKEFYDKDEDREWGQYNNWDWIDSFINELQSLLEKE